MRIVLCLLLSLFVVCPTLCEASQNSVIAEGMAAVSGSSPAMSRQEALHDAQRNAVEKALGTMLSSETLVENMVLIKDKIFTRVEGYVKHFEILSQACDADTCSVTIEAEVEEMSLADDVAALVHILPRMNYPTLVVSAAQKDLSSELQDVSLGVTTLEQTLTRNLADKGFRVADPSALEAEQLRQATLLEASGDTLAKALEAASLLAQVVVKAQAVSQDNGASPYNDRLHSYGSFLTAEVYETATGRQLATATAEANVPHHSFAIGSQKAMEKAAEKLSEELSAQIVRVWLDACYNAHDVSLIVEKAAFGDLSDLKNALAEVRGITRVNQKSFLRGRADLVLGWQSCDTLRLAELLENLAIPSGTLRVLEVQGNSIRTTIGAR